jgi:hypothetical protein
MLPLLAAAAGPILSGVMGGGGAAAGGAGGMLGGIGSMLGGLMGGGGSKSSGGDSGGGGINIAQLLPFLMSLSGQQSGGASGSGAQQIGGGTNLWNPPVDFSSMMQGSSGGGGGGGGISKALNAPIAFGGALAKNFANEIPDKFKLNQHVKSTKQEELIGQGQQGIIDLYNSGMLGAKQYQKNVAKNTPFMDQLTADMARQYTALQADRAYDPLNIQQSQYDMFLDPVLNKLMPAGAEAARRDNLRSGLMTGRPTGATSSQYFKNLQGATYSNLMPAIIAAMNATNTASPTIAAMFQNRLMNIGNTPAAVSSMLGTAESRPLAGYNQMSNILMNQLGQTPMSQQNYDANRVYQMEKQGNWGKALLNSVAEGAQSFG